MPTPTDCRRCGLPYYGAAGLLCDECERDAKCKLAKYQNDSGDDSLYNVRRLRSELAEAIKQRDALAVVLNLYAWKCNDQELANHCASSCKPIALDANRERLRRKAINYFLQTEEK